MKFPGSTFFVLIILNIAVVTSSFAAHPLVCDDTGTQGKGKFLFELNYETSFDKTDSLTNAGANVTTRNRESEVKAAITYGMTDTVDVIIGSPYQWKKTEEDDVAISNVSGIADISLEVKWRFFEKDGLSFAIKPGLTLPAGDKNKDLGTGRVGGTLFLIATKEVNPMAFHFNFGYKRNENQSEQREDIWHASMAGELKVIQNLKLVANIGMEKNTDKSSSIDPAFLLGGFIYSIRDNLDIDFGVKMGLSKTESDYTFLAGMAIKF
jgi:hypothetical protein